MSHVNELNPTWEDCECGWGRAAWEEGLALQQRHTDTDSPFPHGCGYMSLADGEAFHDHLLELDGPHPFRALMSLVADVNDEVLPADFDLTTIFAQHNWRDPVGIAELAFWLDCQLKTSRDENRRLLAEWAARPKAHSVA